MNDLQLKTFCDRFMPSYYIYTPYLYSKGIPNLNYNADVIAFKVGADRLPLDANPVVKTR